MPEIDDVEIVVNGESGFSVPGVPDCDFEYVGPCETGYKIYQVKSEKIAEVNKDCSDENLRSLALSRKDCISFFKERPTFSCIVEAKKVPESSSPEYDIIKAEADYIYREDKQALVEIRKLQQEVVVA